MQNASPIRRYVLLRHPGHRSPRPRWSLERIGPPASRDVERPTGRGARPDAPRTRI